MAGAAATWLGGLCGWWRWWLVPLIAVLALLSLGRRGAAVLALLVAAGALSGALAVHRHDRTLHSAVPEGPVRMVVEVTDDRQQGSSAALVVSPVAVADGEGWTSWAGPSLAMTVGGPAPAAGTRLVVAGTLRHHPHLVRGDPVAGSLQRARVESSTRPRSPLAAAGNAVRDRVRSVVGDESDGRALLVGFLIGDTAAVADRDLEAMRRSGLTHYVAVSGSNVALFLAGVWFVLGLLRVGVRTRAIAGVAAVAVFVVATRWEPSVLRAAVMAVLLFGGAAAGLPLRPWAALSGAVVVLLCISGQLAADVGFQLSVAATGGVLTGMWLIGRRRPRAWWGALGAAVGAQAAVTPLLLVHFGSVPLLSPVANLATGPLVAASTAAGGVAVITGSQILVDIASWPAAAVLSLARVAAQWQQIGVMGAAVCAGALGLARVRALRPLLVAGLIAFVAIPAVRVHAPPAVATAYVLDVGQGDAVLVEDPSGVVMLVDGGRDPWLLRSALRRRGIGRIDLLVVTHGDADHVGGLEGILGSVGIGAIWVPNHPDLGPVLEEIVAEAGRLAVPVSAPPPGHTVDLGDVTVEVIGPRRRYLTQNDGSVVLWLRAGRTMLLGGDVEAVAQRELPELRPDILLVPHHGSATSDLGWLARTAGEVAVVSVGENRYGHPAPEVMDVLEGSGAELHLTRDDGDVVLPLG